MGVSVSVMRLEPVRVPSRVVEGFVREMSTEGLLDDYPAGESGSCVPFTQRKALGLLDRFVEAQGLPPQEREEVEKWLAALPWEGGWRETLPTEDADEEDADADDGEFDDWDEDEDPEEWNPRDGGRIELYFDW